jgi:hypothetical protein
MPLTELVGHRYDISLLIDPLPDATSYIDAGGLSFGIEYRELNAAILDEHFANDPQKSAAVAAARKFEEVGVAVHVCDAGTRTEYLRLDAFIGLSHYHYIVPGSHQTVVHWDDTVQGPMVDRLPDMLQHRLTDMLLEVMGPEQVASYRMNEVHAALPQILAEIAAHNERLNLDQLRLSGQS